jgi:hypothetical protein
LSLLTPRPRNNYAKNRASLTNATRPEGATGKCFRSCKLMRLLCNWSGGADAPSYCRAMVRHAAMGCGIRTGTPRRLLPCEVDLGEGCVLQPAQVDFQRRLGGPGRSAR